MDDILMLDSVTYLELTTDELNLAFPIKALVLDLIDGQLLICLAISIFSRTHFPECTFSEAITQIDLILSDISYFIIPHQ